jgi:hypothetical protein
MGDGPLTPRSASMRDAHGPYGFTLGPLSIPLACRDPCVDVCLCAVLDGTVLCGLSSVRVA